MDTKATSVASCGSEWRGRLRQRADEKWINRLRKREDRSAGRDRPPRGARSRQALNGGRGRSRSGCRHGQASHQRQDKSLNDSNSDDLSGGDVSGGNWPGANLSPGGGMVPADDDVVNVELPIAALTIKESSLVLDNVEIREASGSTTDVSIPQLCVPSTDRGAVKNRLQQVASATVAPSASILSASSTGAFDFDQANTASVTPALLASLVGAASMVVDESGQAITASFSGGVPAEVKPEPVVVDWYHNELRAQQATRGDFEPMIRPYGSTSASEPVVVDFYDCGRGLQDAVSRELGDTSRSYVVNITTGTAVTFDSYRNALRSQDALPWSNAASGGPDTPASNEIVENLPAGNGNNSIEEEGSAVVIAEVGDGLENEQQSVTESQMVEHGIANGDAIAMNAQLPDAINMAAAEAGSAIDIDTCQNQAKAAGQSLTVRDESIEDRTTGPVQPSGATAAGLQESVDSNAGNQSMPSAEPEGVQGDEIDGKSLSTQQSSTKFLGVAANSDKETGGVAESSEVKAKDAESSADADSDSGTEERYRSARHTVKRERNRLKHVLERLERQRKKRHLPTSYKKPAYTFMRTRTAQALQSQLRKMRPPDAPIDYVDLDDPLWKPSTADVPMLQVGVPSYPCKLKAGLKPNWKKGQPSGRMPSTVPDCEPSTSGTGRHDVQRMSGAGSEPFSSQRRPFLRPLWRYTKERRDNRIWNAMLAEKEKTDAVGGSDETEKRPMNPLRGMGTEGDHGEGQELLEVQEHAYYRDMVHSKKVSMETLRATDFDSPEFSNKSDEEIAQFFTTICSDHGIQSSVRSTPLARGESVAWVLKRDYPMLAFTINVLTHDDVDEEERAQQVIKRCGGLRFYFFRTFPECPS